MGHDKNLKQPSWQGCQAQKYELNNFMKYVFLFILVLLFYKINNKFLITLF